MWARAVSSSIFDLLIVSAHQCEHKDVELAGCF